MRLVRGTVNALLMVTLVRPIVRLMVSRWRKQAQESVPAAIALPMQELFEAALVEELSPPVVELELEPALEVEPEAVVEELILEEAGRSAIRILFVAGVVITVATIAVAAIANVIQRRRAAGAREWVAVPVEAEEAEEAELLEEIAAAAE